MYKKVKNNKLGEVRVSDEGRLLLDGVGSVGHESQLVEEAIPLLLAHTKADERRNVALELKCPDCTLLDRLSPDRNVTIGMALVGTGRKITAQEALEFVFQLIDESLVLVDDTLVAVVLNHVLETVVQVPGVTTVRFRRRALIVIPIACHFLDASVRLAARCFQTLPQLRTAMERQFPMVSEVSTQPSGVDKVVRTAHEDDRQRHENDLRQFSHLRIHDEVVIAALITYISLMKA